MSVRHLIFSVVLIFFSGSSVASGGPFGLSWGMSKSEVQDSGVALTEMDSLGFASLSQYSTGSLPKNLSDAKSYNLLFESDIGLVKVVMISETISGDVYGSAGKARYDELKGVFTRKYGNPTQEREVSGMELWDEPDEFYECLAYDGCGYWISLFQKNGSVYSVNLKGLGRGEGYITVGFESPQWSDALDKARGVSLQADEDAI